MKRLSETEDDPVLEIPAVVGIRPIRIQPPLVLVPVDVEDVRVPVGVSIRAYIHPHHHPLNTLWTESYLPSKWFKIHAPSSFFFESSAYATLSQTVV